MTPRATGQAGAGGERTVDLVIDALDVPIDGRTAHAVAVNGTLPGPVVRFREGETAVLRVTNRLEEISSIHWHGILLPPEMDGVPGVSFGGIKPGETFTYRFPVRQSGTYWAHSHSGGQELLGVYFPFIIDPIEPFTYDREYVVMLSDWSFERPETIIGNLKKQAGYYNFQKRTVSDFAQDVRENGWSATIKCQLVASAPVSASPSPPTHATSRSGLSNAAPNACESRVPQFSAFVNRAGRFRGNMARDAARKRKLGEQPLHARFVLRNTGIHLAVRALQIRVGHEPGTPVARTGDGDDAQVVFLDHAIQMYVNEVQQKMDEESKWIPWLPPRRSVALSWRSSDRQARRGTS